MDKKYGDGSANPRSVLLTIKCTEEKDIRLHFNCKGFFKTVNTVAINVVFNLPRVR